MVKKALSSEFDTDAEIEVRIKPYEEPEPYPSMVEF